jgi:hypothetical protein
VAGESTGSAGDVPVRLLGDGHWVAYGEYEVERLTPYHAGGVQRESAGRDQWRYDPLHHPKGALERGDGDRLDRVLAVAENGQHDDTVSSPSLPCLQCASLVVSQLGTREDHVRSSDGRRRLVCDPDASRP